MFKILYQSMMTMGGERTSFKGSQKKSIDDVFEDIVGPAGWAQWSAFIAFGPIIVCGTFPLALLFGLYAPQHRCFVPGCDVDNASSQYLDRSIVSVAIPKSYSIQDSLFDSCSMYKRYSNRQLL